jgi:hypothetical protein
MAPKQTELSGIEATRIKEIDQAALAYVEKRDKRMKLTEQECAAKLALIVVVQKHLQELGLNEHGDRVYRFDELIVILGQKDTVKVKTAVEETNESEE